MYISTIIMISCDEQCKQRIFTFLTFDILHKFYQQFHMKVYLQQYILKSLSPIYFVKIRLPDILCNEFPIKMYRLLRNYNVEICILSKIMYICCKYQLALRIGRHVISYPRTLVCYCHFDVVLFSSLIYINQNVFKSIPPIIVS